MAEWVECRTQADVDRAVKNGDWLIVREGYFEVSGSASVRAYGSASVRASGSASVRASGSASVRASGSASVRASGSASVRAYGSASVRASGSASVRAYDSASVRASGSASVRATPLVAIHKHGTNPKITGGVLVEVPPIKTADAFCDYYGVQRTKTTAVLFKLVGDDFVSGHGTSYRPGEKPTAPDWDPEPCCGYGLHFSPRAFMAHKYASGSRYVACRVKLKDIVVIDDYGTADKVKARACEVLYECDQDGERLTGVKA